MKIVHLPFQQICIDMCSSPEIGKAIYTFYRKHIIFSASQKAQFDKKQDVARINHFKNIILEYDEDSIINVINYFVDKMNKGEVVELQSVYFYACVKNNYKETHPVQINKVYSKQREQRIEKIKKIEEVAPIVFKLIVKKFDKDKEREPQFLFECTKCQNKIFGKYSTCSTCGSILNYTNVDYSKFIEDL